MRTDWLTKALLALIAAGLWMLAVAPGGVPAPAAALEESTRIPAATGQGISEALAAGPATLPLRWQVPFATLDTSSSDTHCNTPILVTNPTSSSVQVEIEFFVAVSGTSMGHASAGIGGGQVVTFWPHRWASGPIIHVSPMPFHTNFQADIDTGDFKGRATVHADDPRIITTAYVVCRDGLDVEAGAKIVGMAPVPSYAVGASLEYFQAGLPAERSQTSVAVLEPR